MLRDMCCTSRFSFGLCVFPKGGSTTFKMFMKRLMHRKDWNVSKDIHSPTKNGLKTTNTDKSFELTKVITDVVLNRSKTLDLEIF